MCEPFFNSQDGLGSVHYLWGGGLANGRGGQAKFTPYLRGGGSERFYSGSGEEGGGGQKSLKVDIIILGFFLPETHDI